jgi:hypothetical protein
VFLDLAKARFQVGQATMLDVRQAEVTMGQTEWTCWWRVSRTPTPGSSCTG